MIISQTPLRISFVGGGSDMKSFYKNSYGAVISTTINKFIYISVNKKFDDKIRVSYSKTENVENVSDIEHTLVKQCLKKFKINKGIEIVSIGDVPSTGTGLGSSSSYTVGLLNCLYKYKNLEVSKNQLAQGACEIEIDKCKEPIGKQDQYACAFGGLNYIKFLRNGRTSVEKIHLSSKNLKELQDNLLIFYTGIARSASKILVEQNNNVLNNSNKIENLRKMVEITERTKTALNNGDLTSFGKLLDLNWKLKQKLANSISTNEINSWYDIGIKNGALGGKILGAGGGGFLLFYAPKSCHKDIIKNLGFLQTFNVTFEDEGSKIIYIK